MRTLWTTIQCPLVSTKLVWRMFSQPSSSSFTCCSLQWLCSWPTKPFQTSWRSSTIQWCPSHTKRSRSLLHQVSSNTQSFVVSVFTVSFIIGFANRDCFISREGAVIKLHAPLSRQHSTSCCIGQTRRRKLYKRGCYLPRAVFKPDSSMF